MVVKRVQHPGTKPYPFMRPAAERLKGHMPELLRNLAQDIEAFFSRKAKGVS